MSDRNYDDSTIRRRSGSGPEDLADTPEYKALVPELLARERNPRDLARANRAARVRLARENNWREDGNGERRFALWTRALVIGSLPMKPTKDRELIRVQRFGKDSSLYVKLAVSGNGQMPFGDDALVAHFMADKALSRLRRLRRAVAALRAQADGTIDSDKASALWQEAYELEETFRIGWFSWDEASEYLEYRGTLGKGNFAHLRGAIERLHSLDVVIHGTMQGVLVRKRMPFIVESALPTSIDPRTSKDKVRQLRLRGMELGARLDERLILDGEKRPVLVPLAIIQEYGKEPLVWRLTGALSMRIIGTRTSSVWPLTEMRDVLGVAPTREIRFVRRDVRRALEIIKREIWRDLDVHLEEPGLRIERCPPLILPEDDDLPELLRP